MTGTLYLCATPIGNLGDMTFRVLDTLREVDLIAAEDTRNSIKLLNHFEIKTPMTSYHEYNRVEKAQQIIGWLKEGKNVALVSDAGTPAISDPGEVLVEMCQREGVPVTSLPGCCACITALTLSGLSTRRFCFEGFLPADKKEKKFVLSELARETRTIILYEAPHHLKRTLGELYGTLGERRVTLCRELTKRFETVIATTLQEAIAFYEEVCACTGRDGQGKHGAGGKGGLGGIVPGRTYGVLCQPGDGEKGGYEDGGFGQGHQ